MRRLLSLLALVPALALGQTAVTVVEQDTITSGCVLGAANATCVIPMRGKTSSGFVITSISTPVGITLVAEASKDGTNWGQRPMVNSSVETRSYSLTNAQLVAGAMRTITMGGGGRFVRVRASAWTSGSITVTMTATMTTDSILEPTIGNALKPTYLACSVALANTAASEAMACEAGASKAFAIRAILVSPGSQTTAAWRTLTLKRTTAAGSAGTAITANPVDGTDAAFSGVCRSKGTAGTAGTTLMTRSYWVGAATAAPYPQPVWPLNGGGTTTKDIVVPAGTANGVAIADSGATGAASMTICYLITEE